jgi:hypothetical protein
MLFCIDKCKTTLLGMRSYAEKDIHSSKSIAGVNPWSLTIETLRDKPPPTITVLLSQTDMPTWEYLDSKEQPVHANRDIVSKKRDTVIQPNVLKTTDMASFGGQNIVLMNDLGDEGMVSN